MRSFTEGVVIQLVMSEGSPAPQLIRSLERAIVTDRPKGLPIRIKAGFL